MTLRPNRLIGHPVERTEDLRFLAGRGLFVDDIERPGLLHAAILRSSVAHGNIVGIDVSVAMAVEGVHAVFTAADIGGTVPTIPLRMARLPSLEAFRQPVIAINKVRFVGEPIAVVVARSRAIAEDALDLIVIDIEPSRVIGAPGENTQGGAPLFDGAEGNIAAAYDVRTGDPDAAFAQADYVRREVFHVHRHTAVPMETRGIVAEWDLAAERMTVWGAAKVPFFNRRVLAQMLDLAEASIDLIEVDVGGGFGVRGEFYPEDFLIPFAARRLGRPVKWIEDRREHLMATNHSRDVACELEIACRANGDILALRGRVEADVGAYVRTTGLVIPSRAGQFLQGPYRISNVALEVKALLTNKTPTGSYRGPGRFEANFFRERMLDIAARDLGIDAAAFRRRNLITEAELPYDAGSLVPYDAAMVLDSGDYHATLERCLAEVGWSDKVATQGRCIDGRFQGVGLACFVESGGGGQENARLVLQADGLIAAYVGSSALGQGIETTFAQIAADALGLPFDRIRVFHGSTTGLDQGFGSFHGRSMIMGGSALHNAAERFLVRLLDAAARVLECGPGEVQFVDGELVGPAGLALSLAALHAYGPIVADGTFSSKAGTYSYGAHAAHVAVDARTGQVEVLDYVAVEDSGRMINPLIVHGQKIGAIVQGLGGTFLDHLVYDDEAQLLTGSLADYLVPTATDFPYVRAISLELRPSPSNPLGVKGAGEDGIGPVAGAIANAVAAALATFKVEPTTLPLSPARLWQLIDTSRKDQSSA